ncbi:TIGR04222 domain-containing membrane protein [Micromonosporaceae bacterium Da 78-11]
MAPTAIGFWSVTGQPFDLYFGLPLLALIAGTFGHRRILFAGRREEPATGLDPQQVAYLTGGARPAVYATLAGLRAAGAVESRPDHTLRRCGPLPRGATALDQAVYAAAGRRVEARRIETDDQVRTAVEQLRVGLEHAGLVVTDRTRRWSRLGEFLIGILTVVGLMTLVLTGEPDAPGGIPLVLLGVGFLTWLTLVSIAPRRSTRAGAEFLAELTARHQHLAPSMSPAYATYGPVGAALGVALFGPLTMYAIDPVFAEQIEVRRAVSVDSGSGGSNSPGGDVGGCGT